MVNLESAAPRPDLPQGTVLEVLRRAGVQFNEGAGGKVTLRCPLHNDRTPSAFANPATNVFSCSRCGSFSSKALASRLCVPWPLGQALGAHRPAAALSAPVMFRHAPHASSSSVSTNTAERTHGAFTSTDARIVLDLAVQRARELRGTTGFAALGFLKERGLIAAIEQPQGRELCGLLYGVDVDRLPEAVRKWPPMGLQLVCGLYNTESGELQSVAARKVSRSATRGKDRRVMNPGGSSVSRAVFANAAGLALLRGESNAQVVVYGEGLTDALSLAICSDAAVLCVPGCSQAPGCVDEWARDRIVIVALDNDLASAPWIPKTARAIAAFNGRPAQIHWPTGCKDANDCLLKLGTAAMRAQLGY